MWLLSACSPSPPLHGAATAQHTEVLGQDRSCLSHQRNCPSQAAWKTSQSYTWEAEAELLTSKMRGITWVNSDDSITREGTEQGEAQAALHGKYPKQG